MYDDGIYFDLLSRPPLAHPILILLLILDVEQYPTIITTVIISRLSRPLDHDLRRAIAALQGG